MIENRSRNVAVQRLGRLLCAMGAATALLLDSGPASAQTPMVVHATLQPKMLQTILIEVAMKQHFFEKVGIDLQPVVVPNVSVAATALASGSVDIASNSPDPFLALADKGQKLQLISGQTRQLGVLMTRAGLTPGASTLETVKLLRGKRIGVPSLRSGSQVLVDYLLVAAGLSERDVTFVPTTDASAALSNGIIDAAMLAGPQIPLAESFGAHVAVDFRNAASCPSMKDPVCGISHIGVWANTSWVQSHPDAVKRVREALALADHYMHDPANAAAVSALLLQGIPAIKSKALQQEYVAYGLGVATAAYAKSDLASWIAVDRGAGIVKGKLDVNTLFATGTPENAQAVSNLIPH